MLEHSRNKLLCTWKKKQSHKAIDFDKIWLNIYASIFPAIKRLWDAPKVIVKNALETSNEFWISNFDQEQSENHDFFFNR